MFKLLKNLKLETVQLKTKIGDYLLILPKQNIVDLKLNIVFITYKIIFHKFSNVNFLFLLMSSTIISIIIFQKARDNEFITSEEDSPLIVQFAASQAHHFSGRGVI